MTTNDNPSPAPSTRSTGERTATIRLLVTGLVILAVVVINLIGTAADFSTVGSTDFLADHALQLAGIVVGLALVVTGIVKALRR